ncbi:MAG: hypothetical protein GXP56_14850 [Deltaproteobacteria bacterium]|nr:hypothetical protein [Deltaproteobacteria bacterium]
MISGIHISSSEVVINKDDAKKQSLPIFKKNQIIRAKVIKLLPDGNARLLVNGQKVLAKTGLLLKPGEDVQLRVIQEKDAVILKLISPVQKMTTRQISSLIGFFSKNESIPDITGAKIANIKDLLHGMALKSGKADKAFLPKLIKNSGMTWENKIAGILLGNKSSSALEFSLDNLLKQDIKGSILKEMLAADPKQSEILKTASSFLTTIENFQLLNHQSSDSGRFLLPFPVFNDQAFSFGQLLIDTGDKNKSSNKDGDKLINISFLLDMSRLGPLRADFSILKKQISGRFLLKDDDTCKYVKSMIFELKTRLKNVGYQVHNVECKTAKKAETQQSSFIESLVTARDDQVLNIVI